MTVLPALEHALDLYWRVHTGNREFKDFIKLCTQKKIECVCPRSRSAVDGTRK